MRSSFSAFRLSTLGALVFITTTVGCQSRPREDSALRISVAAEPSTLDPSRASGASASYLIPNLWEGLTRLDPDLGVEAGVAEMWSFSTDLKTITFTLRDDAVWSDGVAVVSDDFVYSWRRLLDPATRSPHAAMLFHVVNAEEINSGELPPHSLGVEAPHPRTLVVRLDDSGLEFPRITALAATVPLRADAIESHGAGWSTAENLLTNGAYRVRDWRHDYRITLEANPEYFRGPPKIDTVSFFFIPDGATALALYDRGDLEVVLDLLPVAAPHYSSDRGYRNPGEVAATTTSDLDSTAVSLSHAGSLEHLVGPRVVGPGLNAMGMIYLEQLQWAE